MRSYALTRSRSVLRSFATPVSLPNAAGKTAAQKLSKDSVRIELDRRAGASDVRRRPPLSRASRSFVRQGALEWNYTKFLCDKRGVPVKRFKSAFDPLDFEGDVRLLLAGKEVTPPEGVSHPVRMVCNVDRILEA